MKKSQKILGVKINFVTKKEVLSLIDERLRSRPVSEPGVDQDSDPDTSGLICTTNPEFILAAQKDEEFKDIINNSFLSVPDGIGVLYAKHYLNNLKGDNKIFNILKGIWFGLSLPFKNLMDENLGDTFSNTFGERIAGVDLAYDLCSLAEEKGYSIFLLGGWPKDFWGKPLENPGYDLAKKANEALLKRFPNLNIVGATSSFSSKKGDDQKTVTYIKEKMVEKGVEHIDMIFVCYGHGAQEKWIARNANKIPVKLGIGLGGSFDYIAGVKNRAPYWVRKVNLEWLYRLVTQPWRLSRIFKSFLIFPFKVFSS